MNRYEESHAALVELLDQIEQANDRKASTLQAITDFAEGMSANPMAIMTAAPRLAPLLGQFLQEQATTEQATFEALSRVVEVVGHAMDAEEEMEALDHGETSGQ